MSSIKKAQKIANMLEEEFGFFMVQYTNNDLETLKNKLDEFLLLDVDTEDLEDPEDADAEDELNFDDSEEESKEDCE
jgi:hypothetical protein